MYFIIIFKVPDKKTFALVQVYVDKNASQALKLYSVFTFEKSRSSKISVINFSILKWEFELYYHYLYFVSTIYFIATLIHLDIFLPIY